MKNILKFHIICLLATITLFSTGCENGNRNYNNTDYDNVQVNSGQNFSSGLDLQSLGQLAQTCNSASDLEYKLNQTGSINNLDLNEDGQVDYLKVTEYGNGSQRGLSITDDFQNPQTNTIETQEIATINFAAANNNGYGNVYINGNQNLYGQNASYQSTIALQNFMMWNYLFAPHPYYVSPYHYGYYPRTYRVYRTVPASNYTTRTRTYTKSTTVRKIVPTQSSSVATANRTTITSPNSKRNSSFVSSNSLNSPTRSQKSFQYRNTNKSVGSGGFGSSSRSSSSSGYRPSSSSSSRSSFGSSSRSSSSSGYRPSSSSSSSRSSFGSSSRSSSSRSSSRSSSSHSSSHHR